MLSSNIGRYKYVLKVLMMLFVLFSISTPAFAAFDDTMTTFVERVMVIFKTLAVVFIAYAGIRALNGDGELIKPALIGLILIFGADLLADFFSGIFSH